VLSIHLLQVRRGFDLLGIHLLESPGSLDALLSANSNCVMKEMTCSSSIVVSMRRDPALTSTTFLDICSAILVGCLG